MDEKGLGRHIAVARKQLGRSQQEVADAIGISRSSLAQIELGNRSVTAIELARLSGVLSFALEEIMDPDFGEEESPRLEAGSIDKLKNLILYILSKCAGKPNVGREVLNGLLYFSDLRHREVYGESITGAAYMRTDSGLVPEGIEEILRVMVEKRQLGSFSGIFGGRNLTRFIPNEEYDRTIFKVSEIEITDSVISSLGWMNATQISAYAEREK